MSDRVAKVPGSKWRLADWYIAHLPARKVYLEPRFGSGAVLFGKPRSPTVHGDRDALYRHEMMEPAQHEESLTESLLHPGPYLLCSYRNDLYDRMLLGAGWTVVEAQTIAEHGQHRVEALYMNPVAAASRPREQLSFGGDQ